jgi:hypothetical protein
MQFETTEEVTMSIQTGTIEITGLRPEILQNLELRAKSVGSTAEAYIRTLIEQDYAQLDFTPQQIESIRHAALHGRDQIRQGHCSRYDSVDEMMDDVEATIESRHAANKQNGLTE